MGEGNMKNKLCMITGATGGLGRRTAQVLASKGASLILVGRNPAKLERVRSSIATNQPEQTIEILHGNLSEMEEVRSIAAKFKQKYKALDVLINNAGAVFPARTVTSEGHENTIALNHYSWFLLTHLLLDELAAAPSARVVNVASAIHKLGRIKLDDLNSESGYVAPRVYAASKFAMITLTYEFARRLSGTNIAINALHPGVINTGFGDEVGKPVVVDLIEKLFGMQVSVEEGVRTQIYLAGSPDVEGFSGGYYSRCRKTRSSKATHDEKLATALWELTLENVGWINNFLQRNTDIAWQKGLQDYATS